MNTKKTLGLAGNYMDVEEIIYALKKMEKRELNYKSQSVHRAIELLERGEKYERMWEGFRHKYGEVDTPIGHVKNIINDFEQKYFPKMVK